MQYKTKKFAYDTGTLIYKGLHWRTDADDGEGEWEITKFTYDGSDLTEMHTVYGKTVNWTNRATYFA